MMMGLAAQSTVVCTPHSPITGIDAVGTQPARPTGCPKVGLKTTNSGPLIWTLQEHLFRGFWTGSEWVGARWFDVLIGYARTTNHNTNSMRTKRWY
jgi:hypothetical protein